tara:strand:- start:222 stop:2057 length:1836 start_codon:yes stop_codon:yes gene_type:complete
MSTYKEKVGTAVQSFDNDPDNPLVGQLWYNKTAAEFRYQEEAYGDAWSTQPGLNTGRRFLAASSVSGTTALAFGGEALPAPSIVANAESWDGSSWTEVSDLNTARRELAGGGSATSALAVGGGDRLGINESWNGSSWTEVADLNNARRQLGGTGSSNSSLMVFAGEDASTAHKTETETWNGSSWTEVGDLNTGRLMYNGAGTTTSALAFGGETPSVVANTESWNGTAWTDVADLNTGRIEFMGRGTSSTSAIAAGGTTGTATTVTEIWNGTLWTEKADMALARRGVTGSGTATLGLAFGGEDPAGSTEEWNSGIAIGAWYTGNDLNTARNNLNGQNVGTQTAALVGGGNAPPRTTNTELYNGTSWSEVNNMNLARYGGAVVGTQTSCLFAGGSSGNPSPENSGFTREDKNELWNGYVWTESADLNSGRSDLGGAGASNTAAIVNGGKAPLINPPGGLLDRTESWNGSSWTEVADLNTAREHVATVGTQTAALGSGGQASPGPVGLVESWNGSAWTEVNDLNLARTQSGVCGIQTSALVFGGTPPNTTSVEEWNGTNWSNVDTLNTAAAGIGGAGTTTAGLAYGGFSTTTLGSTEEWSGTGLITKTLTTTED